jgi:hypothetical protein
MRGGRGGGEYVRISGGWRGLGDSVLGGQALLRQRLWHTTATVFNARLWQQIVQDALSARALCTMSQGPPLPLALWLFLINNFRFLHSTSSAPPRDCPVPLTLLSSTHAQCRPVMPLLLHHLTFSQPCSPPNIPPPAPSSRPAPFRDPRPPSSPPGPFPFMIPWGPTPPPLHTPNP